MLLRMNGSLMFSLLALTLTFVAEGAGNGSCGGVAQAQNETVVAIMRHGFSTIPGALWLLTGFGLLFNRLDKREYAKNDILWELRVEEEN